MSETINRSKVIRGSRALEMIMRDVLDGMQEFAYMAQYAAIVGDIEIRPDEDEAPNCAPAPSPQSAPATRQRAKVVPLNQGRAA